jgi:DNA polymerase elongation subunit (family B)
MAETCVKYNREYLLPGIKLDKKRIISRKPLSFQIVSFAEKLDAYADNSPSDLLGDGTTPADSRPRYIPQIFGTTENGSSIIINVFGFVPFFLIRCPDNIGTKKWNDDFLEDIRGSIIIELGNQKHHLRGMTIQKMQAFRGFTNFKKFKYIKVEIDNDKLMMRIIGKLQKGLKLPTICRTPVVFALADTRVSSILKFIQCNNIETGGWLKIVGYEEVESSLCHVNYELNVDMYNISTIIRPDKAPMIRLAWDIEVNSHDGHSFPVPEIKQNRIFQISSNFRVEGTKQSQLKVLMTLKECDPIKPKEALDDYAPPEHAKGTEVIIMEYASEKELLLGWIELVLDINPDYMYGFNTFGFDHEYIAERAFLLDAGNPKDMRALKARITDMAKNKESSLCAHLLHMGRTENMDEWVSKILQSSALGSRKMAYNYMSGRVNFDVMHAIATIKNLDQYSLNFCADTLLKTKKKDVPATEIFAMYQSGKPHEIKQIAVYCIVDSELCHDLVDKLNLIWSNAAIATVSSVPQDYIFTRGQSVKIGSYCSKVCRENGIGFDDRLPEKKFKFQQWYEGAYVQSAQASFYDQKMVYVCDFNSLYPSEIISCGFSHDTLVEIGGKYDGVENVIYKDLDIPVKRLFPAILPDLEDRKTGKAADAARKKQAAEAAEVESITTNSDDDDEGCAGDILAVQDGDCAGTKKQKDQDKKIKKASPSEVLTAIKNYLKTHKDFNELKDNTETTVAVPKDPNNAKQIAIFEKKLKKVQEEFPTYITLREQFEGCFLGKIDLPDDMLDARIPVNKCKIVITTKVFRFAEVPGKKGVFPNILKDVLLARAETRLRIKYNEKRIARNITRINGAEVNVDIIEKEIVDLKSNKKNTSGFIAEMIANLEDEITNNKSYTPEMCKANNVIYKKENDNYESLANAFKVTANSFYGQAGSAFSSVYELAIASATTCMGQKDIKLAGSVVEKSFPGAKCIYGDTDSIFVCAEFPEIDAKYLNYELTDEEKHTAIRELVLSKLSKEKLEKLKEKYTDEEVSKRKKELLQITEEEINTSIKVLKSSVIADCYKLYKQKLQDHAYINATFIQGKEAAKLINATINRPPMNIELEKVISRYIQYTQKRYKGWYYTNPSDLNDYSLKTMGLCDKKRDTTKWTVKKFKELTEALMNLTPHYQIIEIFKQQIRDLLDGNVDTNDLVQTKKIGQSYKGTKPAHVICAERIKERKDSRIFHVNDRIPFVITLTEDLSKDRPMTKGPTLSDMIEGYHYAIEHELPINYIYYFSNICMSPLLDTIALIHPDPIAVVQDVCEEYDMPKWVRLNWKLTKHRIQASA